MEPLTDGATQYKILPTGSQRGKPLLVSDDGFSYTVRRQGVTQTTWRCSSRKCSGSVKEISGDFGVTMQHDHDGQPGLSLGLEIKAEVRRNLHTFDRNIF